MKGICFFCSKVPLHKNQKPKYTKERTLQNVKIELYFQQGSSDKVYHLQLEGVDGKWSVKAQWGRRGSTLQSVVKTSDVSYEEAKRVYDRILKEKTGKGYKVAQSSGGATNPPISVGTPPTKEFYGHAPELLTPIDEPEALRLAQNSSLWFQQKFDGRRLAAFLALRIEWPKF